MAAMGDQMEWGRLLPQVWQALADADGHHEYPPRPEASEAHPAWWTPLPHILKYSLGWQDQALGLLRWYRAGRPVTDPRLRLVLHGWGRDLDLYAAWLWESRFDELSHAADGARVVEIDDEWWARVRAYAEVRDGGSWSGGSLHLPYHDGSPDATNGARPGAAVAARGHATLVLDKYEGWYAALGSAWADLPELPGGRSWRIDVVVRPVGWLGTYRRSRLTGRFFAGQHRWHQLGAGRAA